MSEDDEALPKIPLLYGLIPANPWACSWGSSGAMHKAIVLHDETLRLMRECPQVKVIKLRFERTTAEDGRYE